MSEQDGYPLTESLYKNLNKIARHFKENDLPEQVRTALMIAYMNYMANSEILIPRPKMVKEKKKALVNSCRSLLTEINDTIAYTFQFTFPPKNYGYALKLLKGTMKNLEEIISITKNAPYIPPDKGGRKPEIAFKNLVYDLGSIYHYLTGKKPTVTYDNYAARFSGHFFDFVALFCRIAKIKYTNASLGRTIKRIIKNYDWKHRFYCLSSSEDTILD